MRLLRLVPLLALPLLILGATCVTRVDQKDPTGPWVGEITNFGPEAVDAWGATALITDRNGEFVWPASMGVCPTEILPGGKSYFAISAVSPHLFYDPTIDAALPLSISKIETRPLTRQPATRLTFRVLQAYPEHQAIMVEMRNDSPNTYYDFSVCSVMLGASGEVKGGAGKRPSPSVSLDPGQSVVFPLQFDHPIDGSFVFGVQQGYTRHLNTILPSSAFELETYKVVETATGRELWGVGEITNTTTMDLETTVYEVYLTTSPTVRIERTVGPYGPDFHKGSVTWEGNGLMLAGKKAQFRFALPLDQNDVPAIKLAAIEAEASKFGEPPHYFSAPVSNVRKTSLGGDSFRITATVSNPTEDYMAVASLCFNLRGIEGRLVGTSCSMVMPGVGPAGSVEVSEQVTELARAHSVEVIAYGVKGFPVTPPS